MIITKKTYQKFNKIKLYNLSKERGIILMRGDKNEK